MRIDFFTKMPYRHTLRQQSSRILSICTSHIIIYIIYLLNTLSLKLHIIAKCVRTLCLWIWTILLFLDLDYIFVPHTRAMSSIELNLGLFYNGSRYLLTTTPNFHYSKYFLILNVKYDLSRCV